jgi:hypothetical protein
MIESDYTVSMGDPLSRSACLEAPLSNLEGYWLHIQCGCGAAVYYPCKLMAKERGGHRTLNDVLLRLRCRQCKAPPAEIFITDDAAAGAMSGSAWRLGLSP